MYIADQFIFVELHKTGTSHIVKLLKQTVPGQHTAKHQPPRAAQLRSNKSILASIRDPWQWYTSLWAFGCDGKGVLYRRLTASHKQLRLGFLEHGFKTGCRAFAAEIARNGDDWQACYTQADDKEAFRKWLKRLLSPPTSQHAGEGYGISRLGPLAGFMTHRFFHLFCGNYNQLFRGPQFIGYDQLKDFADTNCFVRRFIRNERLEQDLMLALSDCGVTLTDEQKQTMTTNEPTNRSSRQHDSSYYYDRETADLVAEKDRYIIERFRYSPPKPGVP